MTALDENGKSERAQDLHKSKLLCGSCEGLLNESETFFAANVFYPFKDNNLTSIPANEHIGRFAVSVSLRAVWVMQLIEHPLAVKFGDELSRLVEEWRAFLLKADGFKKGDSSHHVILSNEALLAHGLRNSPNLIHSVMRTSAYYLFEAFEKSYVFSNLAGVQVVSMISPTKLPLSRGTEVYPNQTLGTEKPGMGWGGYFQNLLHLAELCDHAKSNLSDKGKQAVDKSMKNNSDRLTNSEDYRIFLLQNKILNAQ